MFLAIVNRVIRNVHYADDRAINTDPERHRRLQPLATRVSLVAGFAILMIANHFFDLTQLFGSKSKPDLTRLFIAGVGALGSYVLLAVGIILADKHSGNLLRDAFR